MRRRFKSLIGSLQRDISRTRVTKDKAGQSTTGPPDDVINSTSHEKSSHERSSKEGNSPPRSADTVPHKVTTGLQSQRMGRRLHRPPPSSPLLTPSTVVKPPIQEPPTVPPPLVNTIPCGTGTDAHIKPDPPEPLIKRIKLNDGGHVYRDIKRDEYFAIPLTCLSSRSRNCSIDSATPPTLCPEAEEACAAQRTFATHGLDFIYFLNAVRALKDNTCENANLALLRWAVLRKVRSMTKIQNPSFCHQLFVRVSGRLSPRIRLDDVISANPSFVEGFKYVHPSTGALEASATDASRILTVIDKCCGKIVYRQGDPHRGRPPQYSFVTAKVSHRTCGSLTSALSIRSDVASDSVSKFENISLSFALTRPTCDISLNRRAAAASPKAFQLGGPLANILFASEWQQNAEIQSLMLSQFIRTMLCGESARFIQIKSTTDFHVWDIILEDFKIQISNFTHLFSLASITACQEGSELLSHSLVKLPFYAVRWESMPDHRHTPCHLLREKTCISIKGSIVSGWPAGSAAALTCPAELKLGDVRIDQLPDFLLWAVYHCPEQVPCTLWVNDPHSGLANSHVSLPAETHNSHFMIENFQYSISRTSASISITLDRITSFLTYAFDTYYALFHVVMESTWQLLRSEEHRLSVVAMVSDPEKRKLLKESYRDNTCIRSQLEQGLPFGQGWCLTSSEATVPNTSLHITELRDIVAQLVEVLSGKTFQLPPLLASRVNLVFSTESIYTTTWSGESLLYLISLLRPRPTNKNWDIWTSVRSHFHVVDAGNSAALRGVLWMPSLLPDTSVCVDEVSGRPIALHCASQTQEKKTFAEDIRWLNYPLALDATHSSRSHYVLGKLFRDIRDPEEILLHAGAPLFLASYSTTGSVTIRSVRELLPKMQVSPETAGTTNAKVVKYLIDHVPLLSTVGQRMLVPPKPSLCMSSGGNLLLAFRVAFVSPADTQATDQLHPKVHDDLYNGIVGILSDYSRFVIMRELRMFMASKPGITGVGLLFFRMPPGGLTEPWATSLARRLVPPHIITPYNAVKECLLNRWEATMYNQARIPVLWSTLRGLFEVQDDLHETCTEVQGTENLVVRALPLSVVQSSGNRIVTTDEWDLALLKDATIQTAGALLGAIVSAFLACGTSDETSLLLKSLPYWSSSKIHSRFIEGLVTESLFTLGSGSASSVQLSLRAFNEVVSRVMSLIELQPPNLYHCICALTGLVRSKDGLYIPYRPSLLAEYDPLTSDGMTAISQIVGSMESLPVLRLMLYEGETPEMRNLIKKSIGGVNYLWNGLAICTAIKRALFVILFKAFTIVGAVMKTSSNELFKKGSLLYDHWHNALILLQEIKWLHCLVLKCPDNLEIAFCGLLCSIGWMVLSLLLGRFTSAIRWSEYAYIAASTLKLQNTQNRDLRAALDQISSFALVQLTSAAYFLNDPDLTVVFGTLARSLRETLMNPMDSADVCAPHFSFQLGPPELPPASMKMLARVPCRKRVYTLISELDGKGDKQNIFELIDKCYVPYEVRALLNMETAGICKTISPVERTEIENCESSGVLLYHLTCNPTFRKINLLSETQSLAFTHSAMEVLEDAVQKLDGVTLLSESPTMAAEDSKSIRREMKAEYTKILRETKLWTRGDNGQAASLGMGRPKCFRYEHALASTDAKFVAENEVIKRQGEDLWWCAEPLPCVSIKRDICQIASGEHHTVCLSEDRKHLLLTGSTRNGQLGFTLDTYRRVFKSLQAPKKNKNPHKEAFHALRRSIRDKYMEQFLFYNVQLGVVSQVSTNYADIKFHLPWAITRPLLVSFYSSDDTQTPYLFKQVGAGASYTALLVDGAPQLLMLGHINDAREEVLSTSPIESPLPSTCRLYDFPSMPMRLSCGPFHVAVITSDHRLFIWGKGDAGQLGLFMRGRAYCESPQEMIIYRFVPTNIDAHRLSETNVASIFLALCEALGDLNMSYIFEHGHVWWSQEACDVMLMVDSNYQNQDLQSALNVLCQSDSLQRLEFLDIACGEAHNIGIARWTHDHRRLLVCWGQNEYGQLGNSNLQFLFSQEDLVRRNVDMIMDRFQGCMSDLCASRQVAKPFLDFVNLKDDTVEASSVFAGGTNSGCSINMDARTIFLWGNNDRGCLTRPEDRDPWLAQPTEIRYDQDVSKVYLCLGDSYTIVRFSDGSVKTYGLLSGLGGTSPKGTWNVPQSFEFSTMKNWYAANRLSQKRLEAMNDKASEYCEGGVSKKEMSALFPELDPSGRVRIPFAIEDVAMGSSNSVFMVDSRKDLMGNLPQVVVRRSFLLKTARSVQRDSATSTRTTTASDGRDFRSDQIADLYDLIHQGPNSEADTMNRILVDLKRPWDPPQTHDLKAWTRETEVQSSPNGSRLSSPPKYKFLEQVSTSGLQGLTHLSQLLVTNVVQKGIENMDTWIDRQSREEATAQTLEVKEADASDRPHSFQAVPQRLSHHQFKHFTPSGSPRSRTRHDRIPTHRSLDAPLHREKLHRHVLPEFDTRPPTTDTHVSQEAWSELNTKLAARSPPKVADILTQVPPMHESGRATPQSWSLRFGNKCYAERKMAPDLPKSMKAAQPRSPQGLNRTADQTSSRSGSDRTTSMQAGSTVYIPRQCIRMQGAQPQGIPLLRPQSAQTSSVNVLRPPPYHPAPPLPGANNLLRPQSAQSSCLTTGLRPPMAPMWQLSRPIQHASVSRSVTGPHFTQECTHPPVMRPLHRNSQLCPRPRVLDFDGQGYSTLPSSATDSPESMVFHG